MRQARLKPPQYIVEQRLHDLTVIWPVKLLRPQVEAVLGLDQLDIGTHLPANHLQAAFQHVAHAQPPPTSVASNTSSLRAKLEVRDVIDNNGTRVSTVVRFSTRPSDTDCSCRSSPKTWNGSTNK